MAFQTLLDADEKLWIADNIDADRFMARRVAHPRFFELWDHHVVDVLLAKLIFYTLCRRGKSCVIEIDGECTPDYGYEDWGCTRCGRGGRVTYY